MAENTADQVVRHEEPSPVELANSWLDYRSLEVRTQLVAARASQESLRNYSQEPPASTLTSVEAGLEYTELPFELAQERRATRKRIRELMNEQDTIAEQRDLVAAENEDAVTTFSGLEKARRAALEAARRREEVRKQGIEFSGVNNLLTSLNEITAAVRTGRLQKGIETATGWLLVQHDQREELNAGGLQTVNSEQIQLRYNPHPQAPRNMMTVRLYPGENEYELDIEDFTSPQDVPSMYGHGWRARQGRSTTFTVREGRVYNAEVLPVLEENRWGYPETHKQTTGREQNLTEQHFEGITVNFHTLEKNIQTLPVSAPA